MIKIRNYFFYLLLIIFPFGEILSWDLGNGVRILINDIVVGVLFLLFLPLFLKNKFYLNSKVVKAIVIFSSVALISLLLHSYRLKINELLISSFYLVRYIAYVGLFLITFTFTKEQKNKVMNTQFIIGTIAALLGLAQYFIYPDLRNLIYLGWDEHLYRSFSTFLDPNFFGLILTLNIILGIFLYQKTMRKVLVGSGILISFITLLLTYSRGSFLSFLISISLLFILEKNKKLLFGFIVILFLGIIFLPKNLQGEGVKLLRTVSITARIKNSDNSIKIIQDNPILGVGFNAYRYTQKQYGFLEEKNADTNHAGAGTDNSFLFILATTGIIGLASYLYLLFTTVKSTKSRLVLITLTAIIIHSLFVNSLFYPFIMEWMWLIIGLSSNYFS